LVVESDVESRNISILDEFYYELSIDETLNTPSDDDPCPYANSSDWFGLWNDSSPCCEYYSVDKCADKISFVNRFDRNYTFVVNKTEYMNGEPCGPGGECFREGCWFGECIPINETCPPEDSSSSEDRGDDGDSIDITPLWWSLAAVALLGCYLALAAIVLLSLACIPLIAILGYNVTGSPSTVAVASRVDGVASALNSPLYADSLNEHANPLAE